MSQFVENRHRSFPASGAIPQYSRVTMQANGQLAIAGQAVRDIGVTSRPAFAAGDNTDVILRDGGTHPMIAAGAIAAGDYVWTAANGQVVDATGATTGAFEVGIALGAASGAGAVIEVVRTNGTLAHV